MAGWLALDEHLVIWGICRCASLACALQSRWQAARLRNHVVNRRCVFATNRMPSAQKRFWLSYRAVLPVAYSVPSATCPPSLPDSRPQSRRTTLLANRLQECIVLELLLMQRDGNSGWTAACRGAVDGHDYGEARLLYDAETTVAVDLVDCR